MFLRLPYKNSSWKSWSSRRIDKTAEKKVKPNPIEMQNQDKRKKYTFHQIKDKKLLQRIHLKHCNKKWVEVNDLSNGKYLINKNIEKKGKIGENGNNKAQKNINFKNNALFTSCISKINNIFIDNNEYLMPTFHLLEYNNDYSMTMTSRTLWKYHRLKLSNDDNHINSVINSN